MPSDGNASRSREDLDPRRNSSVKEVRSWLPFASLTRARDVLRSTFWLVPTLCVVISIGLAIGLIALDEHLGTSNTVFLFPGPPAGARSFLSSIIQAMISFTGLVFSITIVVLQLSSGQFSPRILRTFLRDRTIQFALGIFIGTFVYAMVVLRAVQGTAGQPSFVPQIAVTVAFGFVLVSVAQFIRYINHVANLIRVATIIATVGAEFRTLLEQRYPADQPAPDPAPPLPAKRRTVAATRHGVVVSVNERAIVDVARGADAVVAMVPRVGDFVPAGAPLFTVHGAGRQSAVPGDGSDDWGNDDDDRGDHGDRIGEVDAALATSVALDIERTSEQDLAFGFRELVDIAERALSPGINDPTTAAQAIDELHDLLRRLATRHLPTGRRCDADGRLRLVVPQYGFGDFLDLAVGEIWRYGAEAAQVPGRLQAMLDDLCAAALPDYQPALASWSRRVRASA